MFDLRSSLISAVRSSRSAQTTRIKRRGDGISEVNIRPLSVEFQRGWDTDGRDIQESILIREIARDPGKYQVVAREEPVPGAKRCIHEIRRNRTEAQSQEPSGS